MASKQTQPGGETEAFDLRAQAELEELRAHVRALEERVRAGMRGCHCNPPGSGEEWCVQTCYERERADRAEAAAAALRAALVTALEYWESAEELVFWDRGGTEKAPWKGAVEKVRAALETEAGAACLAVVQAAVACLPELKNYQHDPESPFRRLWDALQAAGFRYQPTGLPTADEVFGSMPELTDGKTVVDYLRDLRGEGEADQLREALAWYADPAHWDEDGVAGAPLPECPALFEFDEGRRARIALGLETEGDEP